VRLRAHWQRHWAYAPMRRTLSAHRWLAPISHLVKPFGAFDTDLGFCVVWVLVVAFAKGEGCAQLLGWFRLVAHLGSSMLNVAGKCGRGRLHVRVDAGIRDREIAPFLNHP
jgi:hypothetical protein